MSVPKKAGDKARQVVTTDKIADVVEKVHTDNGHAGWDATWKDISTSYYGILRSDVIFLLKQCQICSGNPSKRPKRCTGTTLHYPSPSLPFPDFMMENETGLEDYLPELPVKDVS